MTFNNPVNEARYKATLDQARQAQQIVDETQEILRRTLIVDGNGYSVKDILKEPWAERPSGFIAAERVVRDGRGVIAKLDGGKAMTTTVTLDAALATVPE